MAWTLDRAQIGPPSAAAGDATTITLTTNVAVAAGSWIFVGVSNWNTIVELLSVADNGPGLTWEVVRRHNNGNTKTAIAKAYAPSGMASGTVITATYGAGGLAQATGYRGIAGASFAGGGSGSVTDATDGTTGSTAAHSVAPNAAAAGSLIIQSAHLNGDATTSTPDANSTELADWNLPAGPQTYLLQYRIAPTSGATTVGGTWGVALGWASVGGAFSDAGGGGVTRETASWVSTYSVISRAATSWISSYKVIGRAATNWTSTYGVPKTVTWESTYTVRNQASVAWSSSYTVFNRVGSNWSSTYKVIDRVSTSWLSTYKVISRAAASWSSTYRAHDRTAASWSSTYSVTGRIGISWSSTYSVFALGLSRESANWQSSYTVISRGSRGWTSSYAVRHRVSVSWVSLYSIVEGGGVTRIFQKWDFSYRVHSVSTSYHRQITVPVEPRQITVPTEFDIYIGNL